MGVTTVTALTTTITLLDSTATARAFGAQLADDVPVYIYVATSLPSAGDDNYWILSNLLDPTFRRSLLSGENVYARAANSRGSKLRWFIEG